MGKQTVSQTPRGTRPSLWESLLQTTLIWNYLFLSSANAFPLYTLADFFCIKSHFHTWSTSYLSHVRTLRRAHALLCTHSRTWSNPSLRHETSRDNDSINHVQCVTKKQCNGAESSSDHLRNKSGRLKSSEKRISSDVNGLFPVFSLLLSIQPFLK